jgi:hypothetical protein
MARESFMMREAKAKLLALFVTTHHTPTAQLSIVMVPYTKVQFKALKGTEKVYLRCARKILLCSMKEISLMML